MKIEIQRFEETDKSIIGKLFVDNQFECYTLEPARTNPVHEGHPCIPAGTYPVELTFSQHFKYVTPEVEKVPGRTAIRIHRGNRPEDSLGCTLVGTGYAANWVSGSADAFAKLMTLLKTAHDAVTITYIDPS